MSADSYKYTLTVKTACMVSWGSIAVVAAIDLFTTFLFIWLGDRYEWPLYIVLPIAFIWVIAFLIVGFELAAMRWLIWAYSNVVDVYELEKAAMISGFGAYNADSLEKKYPIHHAAIKRRFSNYTFIDDNSLAQQTEIYFRRPWQSQTFLLFFILGTFLLSVFVIVTTLEFNPSALFFVVLGCFFMYFAISKLKRLADRSCQLAVNETHLRVGGVDIAWHEIMNYEVFGGKTPNMIYEIDNEKHVLKTEDLMVSNVRLNHLLFIYSRRHKRDNPRLYRNK